MQRILLFTKEDFELNVIKCFDLYVIAHLSFLKEQSEITLHKMARN